MVLLCRRYVRQVNNALATECENFSRMQISAKNLRVKMILMKCSLTPARVAIWAWWLPCFRVLLYKTTNCDSSTPWCPKTRFMYHLWSLFACGTFIAQMISLASMLTSSWVRLPIVLGLLMIFTWMTLVKLLVEQNRFFSGIFLTWWSLIWRRCCWARMLQCVLRNWRNINFWYKNLSYSW